MGKIEKSIEIGVPPEKVRDMLDFLRQLGVIEPTEKVKKLFPEDVK